MVLPDIIQFTQRAVLFHRLRSGLTALGIAIGVAAVVILTSMGEGLNQFMAAQFNQFGTTNIIITPGKSETMGMGGPGMLNTQRPLTIEDAEALSHLPYVIDSISERVGISEVEANDRIRSTMVIGWGAGMLEVMSLTLKSGQFLPRDDPVSPRALAVIGSTIERELYPGISALGDRIRIGGSRYRIVGVLAPKGQMMGMNPDESIIIPTARAMELYNANTLMDIIVRYQEDAPVNEVVANIRRLLLARHGMEDFTVLTQQQMMEVLDNILDVMTLAVAALGSISLFVGGVGIFTIMTIAVRERTQEIGLLRSLGSTRQQIQQIFLAESVVLASMGGVLGLLLGGGLVILLGSTIEDLPLRLSVPYVIAAELVSVAIGLIAGVVPASHAARLDPLEALRTE
jgi:putative ABC transport system permease protein